jgi:AAA15 family ATPase/GTPase
MLNSLNIENYRNLKKISFPSLAKINLFTGKNSTGKSALLEAITILLKQGEVSWIESLLAERGENITLGSTKLTTNIEKLSNLFTNRILDFTENTILNISGINSFNETKKVSLRFVVYREEEVKNPLSAYNEVSRIKRIMKIDEKDKSTNGLLGFQILHDNISEIYSLDDKNLFSIRKSLFPFDNIEPLEIIRTNSIDKSNNGFLWDKIALTDKESYVIMALKIIDPRIDRITFVGESENKRRPIAMLSTGEKLPLKSMGDGLNRILSVILSLVNADDSYLIIDEFENGLHYTIQEQLWKIIFKLSNELNCQVFATTHSYDCITAFANVLNEQQNNIDGKMFRLESNGETIKQVEYNSKELQIATENNIETR